MEDDQLDATDNPDNPTIPGVVNSTPDSSGLLGSGSNGSDYLVNAGSLPASSAVPATTTGTGFSLSSFLTGLTGAAQAANTLYGNVTKTTPAPATATSAKLIAALPYIIGGGILLVLAFVFMGRRQ